MQAQGQTSGSVGRVGGETGRRVASIGQMWEPITDWLASLPASDCWLACGDQSAACLLEVRRGDPFGAAYLHARNAATWARLAREREARPVLADASGGGVWVAETEPSRCAHPLRRTILRAGVMLCGQCGEVLATADEMAAYAAADTFGCATWHAGPSDGDGAAL